MCVCPCVPRCYMQVVKLTSWRWAVFVLGCINSKWWSSEGSWFDRCWATDRCVFRHDTVSSTGQFFLSQIWKCWKSLTDRLHSHHRLVCRPHCTALSQARTGSFFFFSKCPVNPVYLHHHHQHKSIHVYVYSRQYTYDTINYIHVHANADE